MWNDLVSLFPPNTLSLIWHALVLLWPVWLPVILISMFMHAWVSYKRRQWIKEQGSILLEIKVPKETQKTPAAMEMVLEGIWEDVVGSLTDAYLKGQVRDWFSLEIVSLGGEVKFFIWSLPKWKEIIENRIYTHYPGAEVFEVEDYALKTKWDPETMNLFGINTKLVKADAYPIKTYVEYELDKEGKEPEEIVDPIMPLLEYLGTIKPGEQIWIQIMIQGHRKESFQDVRLFNKADWSGGVKKAIQDIIQKESFVKIDKDKPATLQHLTKVQQDTITAIQRNAGKLAFDSMIRVVYIAPKDIFVKTRGTGVIGGMRQFASKNLNGIRPGQFYPGITYPWQDFLDIRKREMQRLLVDSYKRRSFFNVPYKHLHGKPYVLTTEELATLFHFPGAHVTTPTLSRVPSKKAEAPANLPI